MRPRKVKTALALSSVIGIVILLHAVGWLRAPERWLRAIVTPGSRAIYSLRVEINGSAETFDSVEALEDAYRSVKEESLSNKVDSIELTLLREENDELRQQLSYATSTIFRYVGADVVADVVGRNIEPLGTTIIINRGTQDKVSVGNPVIVGKGILVGKVVRAEEEMSVVRLLTDNQSKVAATVLNREQSIGVIEGGYDVSIRMNFIPQNERVNIGDTVITSGLEAGIPRGLLIGTVDVVQRETYEAFQQAVITPFVSVAHTPLVLVITDAA